MAGDARTRAATADPQRGAGRGSPRRRGTRPRRVRGEKGARGREPIARPMPGTSSGHSCRNSATAARILLGELVDGDGVRRDVQLKGAGRTPFSRGGDGKAALGPVLREYVVSEAMARAGHPHDPRPCRGDDRRSRCSAKRAAAGCRADPRGCQSHPGGDLSVLCGAQRRRKRVRLLADHVIARHYPEAARRSAATGAPRVGRRRAGGPDRPMDAGRLHPRRDEHGQHRDLRGDDRLRTLRVHGRV